MKIINWSEFSPDGPSLEAIQKLFSPSKDYRISKYEYPGGTTFPGFMQSGTCFVLNGRCRYSFDDQTVTIKTGDVIEFPSGNYRMAVQGDEKLTFVMVWNLARLRKTES